MFLEESFLNRSLLKFLNPILWSFWKASFLYLLANMVILASSSSQEDSSIYFSRKLNFKVKPCFSTIFFFVSSIWSTFCSYVKSEPQILLKEILLRYLASLIATTDDLQVFVRILSSLFTNSFFGSYLHFQLLSHTYS